LRENSKLITVQFCRELIYSAYSIYESSDYPKAALAFELAREAAVSSNNKDVLAIASLYKLGRCYAKSGNFEKAIEANLRSMQICEEINSTSDLVHILADLGDLYISVSDYPAAKKYSVRCLDLSSSLKSKGHPTGEWGLAHVGQISAESACGKEISRQPWTFFKEHLRSRDA
jgi:tetratricopeptide (TPR) repeat protein